ncbi:MAG TPA: helix-turn-helix domain-containing protein [Alphaproteobacteria bacterium]|nr:helix-turn-helix domain-containing protein [Alphaproteobacteria bacterium]
MAERKRKLTSIEPDAAWPHGIPHLSAAPEPGLHAVPGLGHATVGGVPGQLRAAREDHGWTLPQAAEALRIRLAYLEAIEAGRWDRLPGTTYALGFIRSYADLLGLDGEDLARRGKDEISGVARNPDFAFPEPQKEGRGASGATVLLGLVVAVVIGGGWYFVSSTSSTVAELVPAIPQRLAALFEGAGGAPAEEPAAAVQVALPPAEPAAPVEVAAVPPPEPSVPPAETPLAAVAAATPLPSVPTTTTATASPEPAATVAPAAAPAAPPAEVVAAIPAPQPAEPTAAAPAPAATAPVAAVIPPAPAEEDEEETPVAAEPVLPSSGAAPAPQLAAAPPAPPAPAPAVTPVKADGRSFGATAKPGRIVIRAVDESWVQVRDAKGTLLLSRVLKAGDSYFVPDEPGLKLVAGNAGGLQIVVDGQDMPKMGKAGQVLRDLALDATRLKGTPVN